MKDDFERDKKLFQVKEHSVLEYPFSCYNLDVAKHPGQEICHWHSEIEISTVLRGSVRFIFDNEEVVLKEDEGIIINQCVTHTLKLAEGSNEGLLQVVAFDPAYIFGYGETYMSAKYVTPVVTPPTSKFIYLNPLDPSSEQYNVLVSRLVEVNTEKKYGYEIVTKQILCELWLIFLETVLKVRAEIRKISLTSDELRAKHAIIFIQQHFAENITLDAIAASVHVSKSECCRCMKRTLQLTPFEYLIKYRIFMSTLMIMHSENGEVSVSEVAASCGFNSTSYFNKWFRHYLGCTPSKYRHCLINGESLETQKLLMDEFEDSNNVKRKKK